MTPFRVAVLVPPTFTAVERLQQVDDIELVAALSEAEVVVLAPRYGSTLREAWPAMARVRWIHSLGAGVETLPFDLLRERDVLVTNSRGVYADALAEFVVAAMMWFAKDLRRLTNNQAARVWEPYTVDRLEGATVGIIGHGSVGEAVARRARALGMRISSARRGSGIPLQELIPASDYVCCQHH